MDLVAADLARLEAINAAMRDETAIAAAAELDYRFHATLVDLVRNRTLSDIYRLLKPVILRLMLLGKNRRPALTDTFAAHAEIIEALRRRDRVAFAYLMSRHLEFGARFLGDAEPPAIA